MQIDCGGQPAAAGGRRARADGRRGALAGPGDRYFLCGAAACWCKASAARRRSPGRNWLWWWLTCFITPAWITGGIRLWRRQALGYLSGTGLLFQARCLFVACWYSLSCSRSWRRRPSRWWIYRHFRDGPGSASCALWPFRARHTGRRKPGISAHRQPCAIGFTGCPFLPCRVHVCGARGSPPRQSTRVGTEPSRLPAPWPSAPDSYRV